MVNVAGMSREELEAEARRIGVIAPERLGRAALERRIRDHHGSPIRRARRAFRSLVGIAKAIAGAPPALPREEPPKPKSTPAPKATPSAEPKPSAEASAAPKQSAEASAEPEPSAEASAAPKQSAEPKPTEPTPSPKAASPAPKSRAEPSPAAEPEELANEPIPTRTMARLLADQGHGRRALAIYRKLLRESPEDADLRQEVERLEASARGRSPRKGPSSPEADDDDSEGVEVVALPLERARVLVAWSVAGRALAEAEALLEEGGELEARVVVVRADSEGSIRREVRERPASANGEWVVPVYAGARVTAAVGLQKDGRFLSVAHAPVVVAAD